MSSNPNRRSVHSIQALSSAVPVYLCALLFSGCSLLLDVADKQCQSAQDCVKANLGNACVRNVCTTDAAADGGIGTGMGAVSGNESGCSSDEECVADTPDAPRCLANACVTEDYFEHFGCSANPRDAVRIDAPQSIGGETVRYKAHVLEFVTRQVPKNLRVKACDSSDLECTTPLRTAMDTDGSGAFEMDLPLGFAGYFDIQGDDFSALLYRTQALQRDTQERELELPSVSSVALLAQLDGSEVDASKGLVLLEVVDCTGAPAPGIHFTESTDLGRAFYLMDKLPTREVDVTSLSPSANIAIGGFLNLEPGLITFTATHGPDGPVLIDHRAHIRAGTATFVDLYL